jgi:hypothetical protein
VKLLLHCVLLPLLCYSMHFAIVLSIDLSSCQQYSCQDHSSLQISLLPILDLSSHTMLFLTLFNPSSHPQITAALYLHFPNLMNFEIQRFVIRLAIV